MNQNEHNQPLGMLSGQEPLTISNVEKAPLLLDQWTASLVQVLRSMTDQKPEARWQPGARPSPDHDVVWWEQPFQAAPGVTVWVAAPRATWESLGTLALKAAGLETVDTAEARNTWIEIVGQSMQAIARSLGLFLGREVACSPGREAQPGPAVQDWTSASLTFPEGPLAHISIAFSPKLLALISGQLPEFAVPPSGAAGSPVADEPEGDQPGQADRLPAVSPAVNLLSPTMDLLMDVELPVSISFGKTQLPMKDVLKLTTGSIVELNRAVNETVEVMVNHCVIARGEVVVVDGNYGVRIQTIASRQDRLRSVR